MVDRVASEVMPNEEQVWKLAVEPALAPTEFVEKKLKLRNPALR